MTVQKKVAVVAFDAGGAEVIAAWMNRNPQNRYFLFSEGPSQKVFTRRLKPLILANNFDSLESFLTLEKPDQVITSSNWASDIEKKTWVICEKLGLNSILYIDGMGDFRYTFESNKKKFFPSEVWVTSPYAQENVQRFKFPKEKIQVVPNFYFEDLKNKVREIEKKLSEPGFKNRILYTPENISAYEAQHGLTERRSRGYNEIEALRYFLQQILEERFEPNPMIRLRPHPSEDSEKYLSVLEEFRQIPVEISVKGSSLEEDIAWSSKVVGCESTALLVALACEKKVYACIPPQARVGCRFPHPEIIRI